MTFDWQENDIKMAQFMYDKMAPIAKAMNPKLIAGSPKNANSHFDTTSYQTTHMNGGAVMGEDPKTSAVNRYLQSWDVHNVFSIGASAFPQGWATTRPAPWRRWLTGLPALFASSI